MVFCKLTFAIICCIVHVTSGAKETNDVAYLTYYTDDACTQFAGIRAVLSGNPLNHKKAAGDISCQDAMACFIQPSGEACQALNVTGDMSETLIQVKGSDVYECDTGNEAVGEAECSFIKTSDCKKSSNYNCHFKWASSEALKAGVDDILPPSDGDGLEDYAYIVYYSDNECTELAALRGVVSRNPYTQPVEGKEYGLTCEEKLSCFLHPTGPTCQGKGIPPEDFALLFVETRGDNGEDVYRCDNTNVLEPICSVVDPEDCIESSVMYGCNFHWRSAKNFAKNPKALINPGDSITEAEAEATSSGMHLHASYGSAMFILGLGFLITNIICI